MNSEELKTQLVRETQAKSLLVESAKLTLTGAVETLRKDLSESAQNFRSDLRDEMKKARESWEETTKTERQKWERTARQAEARLAETKRKWLIWGTVTLLSVVLITAALTVAVSWATVTKGTGKAFATLHQDEATKLADLRAQTVTAQTVLEATKKATAQLEERMRELEKTNEALQSKALEFQTKIAEQNRLLQEAQQRASRLTNFPGKDGTIFVEVPKGAQPVEWQGKMIIQAKTN